MTDEVGAVRTGRLAVLLQRLIEQGYTQQAVANQTGVPAQYLSDLKAGRRGLSELYARRLAEEFDVDLRWLLGETTDHEQPVLPGRGRSTERGVLLPVFSDPIEGELRDQPNWDGSSVEVCGAAAAKALLATQPYVLRFGASDHQGRLRKNDLLLVSQAVAELAEISVVRAHNRRFLARRGERGTWIRLAKGEALPGNAVPVGHCVGIIWGFL